MLDDIHTNECKAIISTPYSVSQTKEFIDFEQDYISLCIVNATNGLLTRKEKLFYLMMVKVHLLTGSKASTSLNNWYHYLPVLGQYNINHYMQLYQQLEELSRQSYPEHLSDFGKKCLAVDRWKSNFLTYFLNGEKQIFLFQESILKDDEPKQLLIEHEKILSL